MSDVVASGPLLDAVFEHASDAGYWLAWSEPGTHPNIAIRVWVDRHTARITWGSGTADWYGAVTLERNMLPLIAKVAGR